MKNRFLNALLSDLTENDSCNTSLLWSNSIRLGHHSRPAWACGNTTFFASEGSDGTSQRKRIVAAKAPRSCATTNPGASTGRIPANVSVKKGSCNRYCGIGKGGGGRKPVCAGYVKTNRHRNSFGAQTGTAPNDTEQPECCNDSLKS
jgi:hypothetical protein